MKYLDFLKPGNTVLCHYPDRSKKPKKVKISEVITGAASQSRILVLVEGDLMPSLDAWWFSPIL